MDSLNRFVEIGEEFTQTEAHTLRGSIKLQSREYFKNFHKTNIEVFLNKLRIQSDLFLGLMDYARKRNVAEMSSQQKLYRRFM